MTNAQCPKREAGLFHNWIIETGSLEAGGYCQDCGLSGVWNNRQPDDAFQGQSNQHDPDRMPDLNETGAELRHKRVDSIGRW